MFRTSNSAIKQILNHRILTTTANRGLITSMRYSVMAYRQPAMPFNFENRRLFSTSNTSDSEMEADKVMVKRTKSAATIDSEAPAPKERKKRRTKAEMEEARALKALKAEEKKTGKTTKKGPVTPPIEMYVLKFNSPILPFAKFPLTHNKYIQEFLKGYEDDKDSIKHVIGVHFPKNSNSASKDTIGIEIKVVKKNNMTYIMSQNTGRYKVNSYNAKSNFASC